MPLFATNLSRFYRVDEINRVNQPEVMRSVRDALPEVIGTGTAAGGGGPVTRAWRA